LKSIQQLIEKDGNNLISYNELRKVIETAVQNLQKTRVT
jgi:Ca2+-binding EF-hand superfamily protein